MSEDAELEVLLSLDGASWEAAEGYMVEFRVHRTQKTEQRPHGINYALVFRLAGGDLLCVSTTLTLRSGQAAGS